ncbi:MAG: hypothetical protein L7S67_03080 [Flavobacteriales bacterium]|jgi:hypothetical protein|nr:hypothetical protein [Flavobacteriales bacterium]
MTFIQRLWRYMIGIAIGTMLAFFFFGSRSCTKWMPNPQVRQFLGDAGLMGDERTRCLMQCGAVTMADLRALLEEGDIQYSASDVRNEQGTGKFYRIEQENSAAEFVVTDTTTLVRSLALPEAPDSCDCP